MPKLISDEITADNRHIWDSMDRPMQDALTESLKQVRRKGTSITMDDVMNMVARQTLPGEEGGAHMRKVRCAATGLPFEPAGLNRPYIMLADRDKGYVVPNAVLVSNAYYALRRVTWASGDWAEEKVMTWIREASEVPEEHRITDGWASFEVEEVADEADL